MGREDWDCCACELAPRCGANPQGGGCRVPAGEQKGVGVGDLRLSLTPPGSIRPPFSGPPFRLRSVYCAACSGAPGAEPRSAGARGFRASPAEGVQAELWPRIWYSELGRDHRRGLRKGLGEASAHLFPISMSISILKAGMEEGITQTSGVAKRDLV